MNPMNPIPPPYSGIETMYIIYAVISILFYSLVLWALWDFKKAIEGLGEKKKQ